MHFLTLTAAILAAVASVHAQDADGAPGVPAVDIEDAEPIPLDVALAPAVVAAPAAPVPVPVIADAPVLAAAPTAPTAPAPVDPDLDEPDVVGEEAPAVADVDAEEPAPAIQPKPLLLVDPVPDTLDTKPLLQVDPVPDTLDTKPLLQVDPVPDTLDTKPLLQVDPVPDTLNTKPLQVDPVPVPPPKRNLLLKKEPVPVQRPLPFTKPLLNVDPLPLGTRRPAPLTTGGRPATKPLLKGVAPVGARVIASNDQLLTGLRTQLPTCARAFKATCATCFGEEPKGDRACMRECVQNIVKVDEIVEAGCKPAACWREVQNLCGGECNEKTTDQERWSCRRKCINEKKDLFKDVDCPKSWQWFSHTLLGSSPKAWATKAKGAKDAKAAPKIPGRTRPVA